MMGGVAWCVGGMGCGSLGAGIDSRMHFVLFFFLFFPDTVVHVNSHFVLLCHFIMSQWEGLNLMLVKLVAQPNCICYVYCIVSSCCTYVNIAIKYY